MKNTRKILAVILSALMVLSVMAVPAFAAETEFDSTWKAIENEKGLMAIENDLSGKYYLANDITLTEPFDPIGWTDTSDEPFTGTFDGNGHTISGIVQEYGSDATFGGLFAINYGTIQNLIIDDSSVEVKDCAGIVAGANRGTIKNVTVMNSEVNGQSYYADDDTRTGLIAGQNGTGGIIENCTVKNCYAAGNTFIGGITGSNLGTVKACTVDNIKINSRTRDNTDKIYDIYDSALPIQAVYGVWTYTYVGGLVGVNQGTLTECEILTEAVIYGFENVGGLVGYNSGTINKCWVGVPAAKLDMPYFSQFTTSDGKYSLDHNYHTNWDIGQDDGTTNNIYGTTPTPDHVHSVSKWTVIKEATCIENGIATGRCDVCGATVTTIIPATGHEWGEWEKNDAETHIHYCQNEGCAAAETEAHKWNEGEVTTEPTCDETGVKTYTCTVCGETKTEVVEATGHVWGEWEKNDADTHIRHCTNEGCAASETEPHKWDEGEVTTEPTCDEAGVKTYTCTVCGETKTEVVEATGHVWGEWEKNDADTHIRHCTNEGCTASETEAHKWDEGEVTTEPTCDEAGVKTYTCTVCGETKTEEIAATSHVWGEWEKNDADTHIRHCTNEGCTASETEPHKWDEGEVTTEPTCEEKGVKTYTCTVCGETKTEDVAATGHEWGEWKTVKAATCVADGVEERVCANDASHVETRKIPATGKHVDNNKDHKCDTCGKELSKCEDKNKDHKCDVCGKELSKCADNNNDHKCDICGKQLGDCKDNDNDGKCDTCGKDLTIKPLGNCSDLLSMLFKAILEALLSMFKGIC